MPTDNRIEFRIGINVGDAVVEDGDVFGDGVNIAAVSKGWWNRAVLVCPLFKKMLPAGSILRLTIREKPQKQTTYHSTGLRPAGGEKL